MGIVKFFKNLFGGNDSKKKTTTTTKKTPTNKTSSGGTGIATMSAASSVPNAKTVYTMEDMSKNIQKEQNKNKVANALGVGLKDSSGLAKYVSETPVSSSSSSKSSSETPTVTNTQSVSDILRANYPTLTGGGGGGSSSSASIMDPSGMIDISNMIKAYEDAAAANKAVVEQSYNERRNDLLTSLKRFQEQNAKDVASQQKTYLANQALVESAIAEADRNNRVNAAARGLGGSGLQQLSQLQTLMSQGQTISDLATQNQETVNNLRELLANTEEDAQTALSDLVKTKENSLKGIESELGTNKASLEYQAREKAADRAHAQQMAEAATAAQIAMQNAEYASRAAQDEEALRSQLATLSGDYERTLNDIKDMSNKQIKNYFANDERGNYSNYNQAVSGLKKYYDTNLSALLNSYNVGGTSLANSQYQTLLDIYNKYPNTKKSVGAQQLSALFRD